MLSDLSALGIAPHVSSKRFPQMDVVVFIPSMADDPCLAGLQFDQFRFYVVVESFIDEMTGPRISLLVSFLVDVKSRAASVGMMRIMLACYLYFPYFSTSSITLLYCWKLTFLGTEWSE